MRVLTKTEDWQLDENRLLQDNAQMKSEKELIEAKRNAQKLKDQQFVAYRLNRLDNPLHALALVAHFLQKITPNFLAFETAKGKKMRERHKMIEAQMAEHDRELRRQRLEYARENSLLYWPQRMLEAHRRNEECMEQIAAMDPKFGERMKREGQKAIYNSEYGRVIEFLNMDHAAQKKMDVRTMGVENLHVLFHLQRIQKDPRLAQDIKRADPAETLANFSLDLRGKKLMKEQQSKFANKAEARERLKAGKLAFAPEPKNDNKRPMRSFRGVIPIDRRRSHASGYGRSSAPRPW
jgi:hypothetical protein